MNNQPRKGLQDITTRSGLAAGEIQNPQRRYLRAASLELKKSLCHKVRDAAVKRVAEMDLAIAALEDEKSQLLAKFHDLPLARGTSLPAPAAPGDSGVRRHRGFALRYGGRLTAIATKGKP
jgi:hypothetical protein